MKFKTPPLIVLLILVAGFSSAAEKPSEKATPGGATRPAGERPGGGGIGSRKPDKTLIFKETPQGELKMDLYFPPGWLPQDKRPAMVFWSGGVFKRSGTTQFASQAAYFASRGLVCACADYRVQGTHGTLIDKCAEDARFS